MSGVSIPVDVLKVRGDFFFVFLQPVIVHLREEAADLVSVAGDAMTL